MRAGPCEDCQVAWLEVGETGIADGLGEADQGGGLDPGLRSDAGDGAEGDLVGVLQREGGDLNETAGKVSW